MTKEYPKSLTEAIIAELSSREQLVELLRKAYAEFPGIMLQMDKINAIVLKVNPDISNPPVLSIELLGLES